MLSSSQSPNIALAPGSLRRLHHIALNVHDLQASCHFYGNLSGPVSRPTGRGIYFYDPDGFLIEIRCDPHGS